MKLNIRTWKEFEVNDIFEIFNSVSYHKKDLIHSDDKNNSIPYMSRTNKNNGLEDIVKMQEAYIVNPPNIIIFGAENAKFFFQPYEHITGNKMYGVKNEMFNMYTGLFIQQLLNTSVKGCGFSYGQGLTGTREKRRKIMLPVSKKDKSKPDYPFMESYIKEQISKKNNLYKNYIDKIIKNIKFVEIKELEDKTWKAFFIDEIFVISPGKRLTKQDMVTGVRPFIGATDSNNGITNFVENTNISLDINVLGVNYNGSVCEPFYHPYECIFSDDVKRFSFKNITGNKFIYLFFKSIILKQKDKYTYGYKFNEQRMKRQYIMVPVNDNGEPDYAYMEQYIKNIMFNKYNTYNNLKNNIK